MKFRHFMYRVTLTLCSASLHSAIAQESQDLPSKHGYRVVDTGTLGGPNSFLGFEGSRNINNNGTLAAGTDTSACNTTLLPERLFCRPRDPVAERRANRLGDDSERQWWHQLDQ